MQLLNDTDENDNAAYYVDMGLGKTFVASERAMKIGLPVLVVCQKSKIDDWKEHLKQYPYQSAVINYDLIWRRKEYLAWRSFTLILDESSLIKNETRNRTKYILKLQPDNVILLSGTPTGGKYEELWSQCHLLGWKISKKTFYDQYIITEKRIYGGFTRQIVIGYKNVDRLKRKLREYGAVFMTHEEALELSPELVNIPEMAEPIKITVPVTSEYKKFKKNRIITIDTANLCEFRDDSDFHGKDITPRKELIGDTSLTKLLYMRQLAGMYNQNKWKVLWDLIEGTNRRIVIFYNFQFEFEQMKKLIPINFKRPISYINGSGIDLTAYERNDNAITLIQYQAGSMGHNLQLANITIYFSLPLSSELYEQSKARTHRIGQKDICFYYYLIAEKTVEENIFDTLKMRKDFTDELFMGVDK